MTTKTQYNDLDRAEFLQDLDDSGTIEVTDWEARFIESNLGVFSFTPKQRETIAGLMTKYARRLGWR